MVGNLLFGKCGRHSPSLLYILIYVLDKRNISTPTYISCLLLLSKVLRLMTLDCKYARSHIVDVLIRQGL